MDAESLAFLPLEHLAPLVARKKISPVELVEISLARIERLTPRLNAYLTVIDDVARVAARRADLEIRRGRYRGPLHGIPLSLKDNIWTGGIRTTAGSKILADFVPAEDATIVRRLKRAGAILLGKTNLHEFAYGVTTENPHVGTTRNPWANDRIAGGSSGGSAAALAAGMGWASVGTDTGGSIRIPSALCGTVGLKPTFGRVSCHGVVPLARTLDHAGPMARSVAGVATVLRAIAGRDRLDPSTVSAGVPDYFRELRKPLRRFRLGWPTEFFFDEVDAEIRRAVDAAARELERLGATLVEIALPRLDEAVEPSNQIALAEATCFHESAGYFPARATEYGKDVRTLLEMGARVSATDYLRALELRRRLRAEFELLFERVDVMIGPTTPIAAPVIGEKVVTIGAREEPVRAALIRLNRPANFFGVPAISLPCGFTRDGLPIGLQLMGRAWGEARLLAVAFAYEQTTDWHCRFPRLP